jgi:tripartite-type tricarboxylate transporter receptor subunit TctC
MEELKMKKLIVILAVVSLLATMFVGCNTAEEPGATQAPANSQTATEAPPPEWPTESVTIVCPDRAGGFADSHSRMLADYLQRSTGVPFVVVNLADGGGVGGTEQVRQSDPDGLTLLHFHTSFPIACFTGVNDADVEKDFTLIAAVENGGYHSVVVKGDAPWNTLEDLVNDAKNRPGEIIWAAKAGVTSHFMLAMLEQDADVKFKMVDGGGTGDRVQGILGGSLEVTNIGTGQANQYVEAGDMKILAVIGEDRDPVYTQYQTAIEQGYNMSWAGEFGLWGPAGMDPALVKVINAALADMENDETAMEQMTKLGAWFEYRNVEESNEHMSNMYEVMKQLANDLGFND